MGVLPTDLASKSSEQRRILGLVRLTWQYGPWKSEMPLTFYDFVSTLNAGASYPAGRWLSGIVTVLPSRSAK
jgi:hypothetical protein